MSYGDSENSAEGERGMALWIAISGMLSLAVAIGIGRFAFTLVLPMMQADAGLTLRVAGWLASANYVGYLVGALSALWIRIAPASVVRGSLLATAILTAGMALTDHPAAWLILRGAAGVVSAWILVFASAGALQRLSAMERPALGGVVFGGVGLGAALAGVLCLVFLQRSGSSDRTWIALAVVALLMTACVWPAYRVGTATAAPSMAPKKIGFLASVGHRRLIACYGCFGFGYIIPATFLPAMAREAIADPMVFGWAWPVFGVAAFASTLVAGALSARLSYLSLWRWSQLIMAFGVLLPALVPGIGAIVTSAICVGGTFVVATMAGMQEARRAAPQNAAGLMAAMTSAFAFGQILGPLLVSFVAPKTWGLEGALLAAATALLLSSVALFRHAPESVLRAQA
jgi:MFS family permease